MAYLNNNGGFQQIETRTTGLRFFDDKSMLKLDFGNDMLTIRVVPAVIREDGSRSFPSEINGAPTGVGCAIKGGENIKCLVDYIHDYFEPRIHDNPSGTYTIGIPTNKDNTTLLILKYMEGDICLNIHSGINGNRIPTNTATFRFQNKKIFTSYSETTGDFTNEEYPAQFKLFVTLLDEFTKAVTMAMAHYGKVSDAYASKRMRTFIEQIAQKNGIPTQSVNYNNNEAASNKPNITATADTSSVAAMFAAPGADENPF